MRAILYVKQILLTHPHLKKYYFPICAKCTEPLWGLCAGVGGQDGIWGALGPGSTGRA